MASGPSSRPTRYSSGDNLGCMGGIIHLFDFNQALAGRKFLTDKKNGEGLEAAVITSDGGSTIPEVHKSYPGKSKEIPFGYESRKGSKSSGTPIKSLIAPDLEPEPSNRTPNVVARLMGLDVLPADSKALKKSPSVRTGETPSPKTTLDRKFHEEKPLHNVKTYAQKAITSPVHNLLDLAASKRPHKYRAHRENDVIGVDSISVRSNVQEQQLQELNDFAVWQNQKSGNHCSRSSMHDDLDLQWAAKYRHACGKLQEATLGFLQENLSCAKHNIPQERLHESKEFLDAMDFLQCNKEFFMRFLQDPDTSFARHLQDDQDDSVPIQPTQAAKYSQSYQSPDPYGSRSEAYKPQCWRKESPESRKSRNSEQQLLNITGADAMVEMNLASKSMEPSLVRDVSLVQDQEGMDISLTMHSRSRTSSVDCNVPTRIVVLKPSPGRTRNLKSPSVNYQKALKDQADEKEVIREDHDVALEDLRERLRKESRENLNHDKRNTWLSLNEHGREILKDQREIAQKIARQVKEYASRDSMFDSGHARSNNSTLNGTSVRRNQSSRSAIEEGSMASSSDGETNVAARRLNCDQLNRICHLSSCQNRPLDMQAEHERKEGRRRNLERCKTLNAENAEQLVEMPVQVQNGVLRKSGFIEDSPQAFPGSKSSHSSRGPGMQCVDGTNASENSSQMPCLVSADKDGIWVETNSPCEMEIGYSLRYEVSSPKILSRSRSVPLSSASASGRWEERSLNKAEQCVSELNNSQVETADFSRIADATTGSIFIRKVSGLKGSFSLRRKQTASKEHCDRISFPSEEQAMVIQAPTPHEESAAEKLSEDFCAARQKNQRQIRDSEQGADNESSISLADHFLSLEPAMSAEIPKGVEGHVSQQFCKALLTTDSSIGIGQILEQESQENTAEYEQKTAPFKSLSANSSDVPASINSELPKEQSEQPSPVSVLDVPFLEESESPMDFKEISCDLQELRMHLRLLKFDEPDLDTTQDEDSLVLDENLVHPQTVDLDSMVGSVLFSSQPECADFTKLDCPIGKEPEMLYVKDVLVASGFTGDSTAILTRWYAPGQPLDPFVFQKVESTYSCKESHIEGGHASLDPGMRHLLFDRVNEVLLELLCPYLNHRPWMKHNEVAVSSMPTGKDLVKHVWAKVCQFSCAQSKCQETLENLMTKDLANASLWIDLVVGIETVGLEVERAIFHDLIEETLLVL